ncbi:MAG: YbaB/EbfC family nucleoid-associated protein [Stackebrandtia sp.]
MRTHDEQRLHEAVAHARRRLGEIQRAARRTGSLEVTATSGNGEVAATVDSQGRLKRVRVDPGAMRDQIAWSAMTDEAANDLEQLLTRTIQRAQEKVSEELRKRQAAELDTRPPDTATPGSTTRGS